MTIFESSSQRLQMRKIKIDGVAFVPCGPGGTKCDCCFPPPGPIRKVKVKHARRKAERMMLKEQMESLEDS